MRCNGSRMRPITLSCKGQYETLAKGSVCQAHGGLLERSPLGLFQAFREQCPLVSFTVSLSSLHLKGPAIEGLTGQIEGP